MELREEMAGIAKFTPVELKGKRNVVAAKISNPKKGGTRVNISKRRLHIT